MAEESPKRRKHRTEPPPLTAQEIRFCQHWVEHGNATKAYTDSGIPHKTRGSAAVAAWGLLRKPKIRAYIRELQFTAADAAMVTVTAIAQGLARTGFADRRKLYDNQGRLLPANQWPDDVAATIERVESEELYEPVPGQKGKRRLKGYVRKVWTGKRTEAQKVLAQWLRMIGSEDKDTKPTDGDATTAGLDFLGKLAALLAARQSQSDGASRPASDG